MAAHAESESLAPECASKPQFDVDSVMGADERTWFPTEFRFRNEISDTEKLGRLVVITRFATSNSVPLTSLWQPGGALRESLEGDPPRFTRTAAASALLRLRRDILRTGNTASIAQHPSHYDSRRISTPATLPRPSAAEHLLDEPSSPDLDSGFFDGGAVESNDEDDSVNLKDAGKFEEAAYDDTAAKGNTGDGNKSLSLQDIPPSRTLAAKVLDQLQYNRRLTDDVLHFLSTLIFSIHQHGQSAHGSTRLMHPLWFRPDTPPAVPRFFKCDTGLKDTTLYMPMHVSSDHWVLVHLVSRSGRIKATIYDPLPSVDRTKNLSACLSRWLCDYLPSSQPTVIFQVSKIGYASTPMSDMFQDCARQFDVVNCGVFVAVFLERLLHGQALTPKVHPRMERTRLLELIRVTGQLPGLDDIHLDTLRQIQGLMCAAPLPSMGLLPGSSDHTADCPQTASRVTIESVTSPKPARFPHPATNDGETHFGEFLNLPLPRPCLPVLAQASHVKTPSLGVAETGVNRPPLTRHHILDTPESPAPPTGLKRKIADDGSSFNISKRQNIDMDDIASLSTRLVQALKDKSRSRKRAMVSEATNRLDEAENALSVATTSLNEAEDALERGNELELNSCAHESAFKQWIDEAPKAATHQPDTLFLSAVQGSVASAQAFLDQYIFSIQQSMAKLAPNVANASREVERWQGIVDSRKRELEVAQEAKDMQGDDLQKLDSLLARLSE
ncbi:hypothetical protein NW762_014405 [Fusarium torreyae]|uniref:Ubiquitin-like protease family profile domain-containing protein n=1 Tax=Fusarium torreyae TaxID=1237075 RepID=A0A9W8RM93_9HYPO|nr:hypothetical protein NW762_014405 [Fusarium torreyae]